MTYAIINGIILNGHADMKPQKDKAIIVEGEKIKAIVDKENIPEGIKTIDLRGKFILPGLINLHVHIPSSGKPTKKKLNYEKLAKLLKLGVARAVVFKMCESNAKTQLLSGTTTIRAVGGVLDFDTKLRNKINAGKVEGPRILAANTAISVPGGHMTGSVALPAHSVEEAVQMVHDRDAEKPDLIKLMITGGVLDAVVPGEPGVLRMPKEYVKAACDEAHKLGYKVAAHVESTEGMIVALENGVDTIEHGGKPTEETTRLFKEKNAILVATLSPAVPFALMDQAVSGLNDFDLINGKALFAHMKECVNNALENGITVGLGTDTGCPYTTHYDMWRELWYFKKYCGVSSEYAIHTATEINARILGLDNEIGTIDEGKSADFVVVENDPIENVLALRDPTDVFFKGKYYANPKPKKFKEVDYQLDRIISILSKTAQV